MLIDNVLEKRAGNFTASGNYRLMAGWDNPEPDTNFNEFYEMYSTIKPLYHAGKRSFLVLDVSNLFDFKVSTKMIDKTLAAIKYEVPPPGLITYAKEKAVEHLFDFDPSLQFSNVHTRNGEEREQECMEILSEKTGVNFIHTGEEQVHIHNDGVGCTPDGIALDDLDLIKTGAEVKCKSPLEHALSLTINSNKDLMEKSFDHYVQIQSCMMITEADYWYFANYNPFANSDELRFKYVVIERDNRIIKVLKKRIEIAKKIKQDFIDEILLSVNKQFKKQDK